MEKPEITFGLELANGTLHQPMTEADVRECMQHLPGSKLVRIERIEVRKPVWVGPHRDDTEDCWVREARFSYPD